MNDKKNIDRLFQEKFKDFEAEPNDQVWINIETAIKEKKKERRIIPFWIRFSGIAAALFIGLFTLNMLFKTNTETTKSIVLDLKNLNKKTIQKESITNKIRKNKNLLSVKNNQQVLITNSKTSRKDEKEITTLIASKTFNNKKKNQSNTKIHFSKNYSPLKNTSNGIATTNYNAVISEKINTPFSNSYEENINKTPEKERSEIVAIASKKDSINTSESPNELEEILKTKQTKKQSVALSNKNKWQIVPNVAAVYLNSNSGGSSIDPKFSGNQKTTDNSLSFGLGVNYAISKKIALRTGINKLTLGYNTNGIVYSPGLSINSLANINYSSNQLIEVQNLSTLNSLSTFEKDLQKTSPGSLNQKMGYYEVPLEISYAILDHKFGINIIGGISTLLLNQNEIALVSPKTNLTLGEANNLKEIHFSTNIGLGFKYQLVKSFQINFEPMVKYQLNTYTENSGNYKPVFIGLYTGIIYNFK
jgi:hypothetical protein